MGDMDVDYRNLSLPTDKAPEDYSYQERRADILQNYILDKGHPDAVNWSRLSRYYSKSKSTLHNDKTTLTEWLVEELNVSRVSGVAVSLFEQGLLEIQADEDYDPFDYHSFVSRWVGTLEKLGVLDLEDDVDDLFSGGDGQPITVAISGVEADMEGANPEGLPERDRIPEDSEAAAELEAVPEVDS